MNPDWEIIRKILIALEKNDPNEKMLTLRFFPNEPPEIVSYNMKLLISVDFVNGKMSKELKIPIDFMAFSLTRKGYEFLANIENENQPYICAKIFSKFTAQLSWH